MSTLARFSSVRFLFIISPTSQFHILYLGWDDGKEAYEELAKGRGMTVRASLRTGFSPSSGSITCVGAAREPAHHSVHKYTSYPSGAIARCCLETVEIHLSIMR